MCHYTRFGMASTNLPTFLNMSLPVRHSPPGHQPSCSRICSFLCSLIHTSSSSHFKYTGKGGVVRSQLHHNLWEDRTQQQHDAVFGLPKRGSLPPGQSPGVLLDTVCRPAHADV